jgi:tetratricopeptide (TPR) repeat protein
LAGFLTYEFQNLIVFDTISASLMFFSFLGFAGFLWQECQPERKDKNQKNDRGLDAVFVNTVTVLCALGAVYFIYIGNITGIVAAKDVNYGYAYATVDPQIAKNYFEAVRNSPFDFDPVQSASKYTDSVVALASNPGSQTTDYVNQNLKDAVSFEQDAVSRVPNDPTAWQEIANLYLTESIFNKTALDPNAIAAAQKAMDLAPRRPEPILLMARLNIYQNNYPAAESLLNGLIAEIPQDYDAKLQLGLMYAYAGQADKGLAVGQAILASGFKPTSAGQIDWMAKLYDSEKNYAQAANIYELALAAEPSNLQDQWALAQDYAKLGKNSQAVAIVQNLITEDPKDAQAFQNFIDSLK